MKKFICLMLLAIVCVSGESFGALAFTNFLGTASDGLWTTGANWNTGVPVDNRTNPNPMMSAKIYNNMVVGNQACLITDGMDLSTYKIRVGDAKANSKLIMSDGLLTVTSTEGINDFVIGTSAGSNNAVFEMTGGIVNVAGQLKVNQVGTLTGLQLRLYGGTFNAQSYAIGGTLLSQIDITEGRLMLPGDVTYVVGLDIAEGQIVGYGGTAQVNAVFDGTNTIVSVPEPATLALFSLCLVLIRRK